MIFSLTPDPWPLTSVFYRFRHRLSHLVTCFEPRVKHLYRDDLELSLKLLDKGKLYLKGVLAKVGKGIFTDARGL